jgi:hypothetical protein
MAYKKQYSTSSFCKNKELYCRFDSQGDRRNTQGSVSLIGWKKRNVAGGSKEKYSTY